MGNWLQYNIYILNDLSHSFSCEICNTGGCRINKALSCQKMKFNTNFPPASPRANLVAICFLYSVGFGFYNSLLVRTN